MINAHFHDEFSSDARGRLTDHCAAAGADWTYLCVTNHAEAMTPGGRWEADPEEMIARFRRSSEGVETARRRWPGRQVRLGVELEYRPEWRSAFDMLLRAVPFDFVLGSVHVVDGHNISGGPGVDAFFSDRDQREAYEAYFDTMAEMLEWGGFDAVAHFDLIKRYGHRHYGAYEADGYRHVIEPVLARMAALGLGIEVNTSGVGEAPGRPYPDVEVLRWARESGVPSLTIGSDSHRPETIGQGLREGHRVAAEAGWDSFTLFADRAPSGRAEVTP